ncbi:serine hydrolase domain-containing protein [Tenacibaculum agarivorans]|uniref:serine hydrolase domain-containing protein n=1 Tax=Tenacibaculum agarivorans TaxID=1908389 RepID=UPI00094BAABA|nr:serine hydrolase domain-containing protein [Tenacibaculum agarivorans]
MRKPFFTPYIFCLCILIIVGCQFKEKSEVITSKKTIHQLDSLFQKEYREDKFHGGIVITQKGETLYENYFGLADRSWNIVVDENTKFDIASVNKSMIAALTLKAVEKGMLNLEDKLVGLLSPYSYSGSFHSEITLHYMLCHRSGLPDYDAVTKELKNNNYLKFKRSQFTNEAYVDFISRLTPVANPDKKFYYSNFGYHLIAIILEKTYHKPFDVILKENLTQPLGLRNTVSASDNGKIISKLAKAYTYNKSAVEWSQTPFIDLSLGRRVFSTAKDLNKWAQVMGNPGWLSKKSLELLTSNYQTVNLDNISYGYGWFVFDKENRGSVGYLKISKPYIIHGGSTDGYKSMLININKQEYVISFLSNVGNKTNEMELAQKIVNILIH